MRRAYRIAMVIAVLAFLAANIFAWLKAPSQMAMVTLSALIVYWLNQAREEI